MIRLAAVICLLATSAFGIDAASFESRILNGNSADPGEYPSQIYILWQGAMFGAASVISTKWALTAGHCISGFGTDDLILVAGTNTLDAGGSVHHPARFIVHQNYNFDLQTFDVTFDIGLIEVTEPFVFGPLIQPVSLPTQDLVIPAGSKAVAIGWGYTDATSTSPPNELQEVTLDVIDQDVCKAAYEESPSEILPSNVCAGSISGDPIGTCKGDSGGPLFQDGLQVGVTSKSYNGCGANPEFYDVYTRVSYFRDWIKDNSGI